MSIDNELECVEILLSTYNGGAYLPQFFSSLESQEYKNWKVLIRDDGSTDQTLALIQKFVNRQAGRVMQLKNVEGNLGAKGGFSKLMEFSSARYVMFADQDDVWLPSKIKIMAKKAKEMEVEFGPDIPLLVHSDLMVVDQNLNVVSTSFWTYQNLKAKDATSFSRLLVQNYVTGCAMLANRSLLKLATPVPVEAAMHDWWCALVASAFGKIGVVQEPTILYRQHDKNTVGAKRFNVLIALGNFIKARNKILAGLSICQLQAEAFLLRYEELLQPQIRKRLGAFIDLKLQGILNRRITLMRNGFVKSGALRTLGLYVFI